MTAASVLEYDCCADDLVAALGEAARSEGQTAGKWPGLTFYRVTQPTVLRADETTPVSIGVVVSGGTSSCLVVGYRPQGDCHRLYASPEQPCLYFLLEIDPQLVSKMSNTMLARAETPQHSTQDAYVVSTLDDVLICSAMRFLRSLTNASDRRVLAPLYMQEFMYRVLQRDRYAQLVRAAAQQLAATPIAEALDYLTAHLAEPLTVAELAKRANLSESAFTRQFRDVTGRSPYQLVKEKRLRLARDLFDEGRLSVTEVARNVGYTSSSHFIKDFRNRFGTTPGDYADAHTAKGRVRFLARG